MPRNSDLPWLPLFADDWLTDVRVRSMSPSSRGIYVDLLCYQWREEKVPYESEKVRRLARVDKDEWSPIWRELKEHFPTVNRYARRNPRLWEIYQHQRKLFAKRQNRAKSGGHARARKRNSHIAEGPSDSPIFVPSRSDLENPESHIPPDENGLGNLEPMLEAGHKQSTSRAQACFKQTEVEVELEIENPPAKQDRLPYATTSQLSEVVGSANALPAPNPFGFIAYWQDANEHRGFSVHLETPEKFGDFMESEAKELGLHQDRRWLASVGRRALKKFTATYSKRSRGKTRGSAIGPKMLTEELVAWVQKDLATIAGGMQKGQGRAERIDEAVKRRLRAE